jgi:hypothetical protein
MEDELWMEKQLERIRQEFNLTDEQFNQLREQRGLESQIAQERLKDIHLLLESNDPHERHQAIVQIFAWMLDSMLQTYKLPWKGYEQSYVELSERLLRMITSQERRLSKLEQELETVKRRMGEAAWLKRLAVPPRACEQVCGRSLCRNPGGLARPSGCYMVKRPRPAPQRMQRPGRGICLVVKLLSPFGRASVS